VARICLDEGRATFRIAAPTQLARRLCSRRREAQHSHQESEAERPHAVRSILTDRLEFSSCASGMPTPTIRCPRRNSIGGLPSSSVFRSKDTNSYSTSVAEPVASPKSCSIAYLGARSWQSTSQSTCSKQRGAFYVRHLADEYSSSWPMRRCSRRSVSQMRSSALQRFIGFAITLGFS